MDRINLGIIGFGTVGAGTVEILQKNRELIQNRVGAEIVIKRIADLDTTTDRGVPVDSRLFTTEAAEIIADPEIDIVAELMGGVNRAREYILSSLEKGKHVVTANKALLAEYGEEIFRTAQDNRAGLAFEASVGGGIPVIRAFKEGLTGNRINMIMGILNGTSNYILTQMTQHNWSYSEAVHRAVELGYAEDPPTLDVDGTDAAHKLAILIALSCGSTVNFREIFREGIDRLTPEDVRFAGEFGYCIKLLAVAKVTADGMEARVHPAMIPQDHILVNVNDVYNAIYVEGDFLGPNLYYGQGAGKRPTGSAVVSDIIALARQIRQGVTDFIPPLGHMHPSACPVNIRPVEELVTAYYFRFSAMDKPGVLSKISGILGDHQISISSVIQKDRGVEGPVPIVMLTHEAKESNVLKALSLLEQLEVLTDRTMVIRVEQG